MSKRQGRTIIIIALCFVAVGLSLEYKFLGPLTVTGTSGTPTTNWKIGISDISICTAQDELENSDCQSVVGDATNVADVTKVDDVDSLKATFATNLYNVGDSMTYKVTVKNEGKLSAKLTDIKFDKVVDETTPVIFSYLDLNDDVVVASNSTKTFYVMVTYLDSLPLTINTFTNSINLTFSLAE